MKDEEKWQQWSRQLAALGQTGLTYAQDQYDIERYKEIQVIAADMFALHTQNQPAMIHELLSQQDGYATPKVDVRGVVMRDGAVLLVKERVDHKWTLPGGWADVGDTPSECVVREIREESGFETRAVKLLAVYDRNRHAGVPPMPFDIYKLFFLCEMTGGQPQVSNETEAVDFFRRDAIPELSSGRVTPWQLERMFEHYEHPDWPADFD